MLGLYHQMLRHRNSFIFLQLYAIGYIFRPCAELSLATTHIRKEGSSKSQQWRYTTMFSECSFMSFLGRTNVCWWGIGNLFEAQSLLALRACLCFCTRMRQSNMHFVTHSPYGNNQYCWQNTGLHYTILDLVSPIWGLQYDDKYSKRFVPAEESWWVMYCR